MSPWQPLDLRRLSRLALPRGGLEPGGFRPGCTLLSLPGLEGDLGTMIRAQLREELTTHWYPHAVEKDTGRVPPESRPRLVVSAR